MSGRENSKTVVLIAEDEPMVRLCAVQMVEEAGFGVVEAASADEAIRILESSSDIQVMFTDIQTGTFRKIDAPTGPKGDLRLGRQKLPTTRARNGGTWRIVGGRDV